MINDDYIIKNNDLILITGSNGYIGSKVVETLMGFGFTNLRCFIRPSADPAKLNRLATQFPEVEIEIIKGNLLSPSDCRMAVSGVKVIYHLAAGTDKSFPGCFLNSVVSTRNLLDAVTQEKDFKRFVNTSSITVYTGLNKKRGSVLDETSEIEQKSYLREEAYAYGKIKQDDILYGYHERYNIPYVIVRPGVVYGPGKKQVLGRVGIDTFGFFMHLGGSNQFPLTYVDNCAEAIVLAGLKDGIDGEVFNIIDDDIPTCRQFLRMYKKKAEKFRSVYVPYRLFYFFCWLWEKYSDKTEGQLPRVFNRMRCEAHWKGRRFNNDKAKTLLGWKMKVPFKEASMRYFDYVKSGGR